MGTKTMFQNAEARTLATRDEFEGLIDRVSPDGNPARVLELAEALEPPARRALWEAMLGRFEWFDLCEQAQTCPPDLLAAAMAKMPMHEAVRVAAGIPWDDEQYVLALADAISDDLAAWMFNRAASQSADMSKLVTAWIAGHPDPMSMADEALTRLLMCDAFRWTVTDLKLDVWRDAAQLFTAHPRSPMPLGCARLGLGPRDEPLERLVSRMSLLRGLSGHGTEPLALLDLQSAAGRWAAGETWSLFLNGWPRQAPAVATSIAHGRPFPMFWQEVAEMEPSWTHDLLDWLARLPPNGRRVNVPWRTAILMGVADSVRRSYLLERADQAKLLEGVHSMVLAHDPELARKVPMSSALWRRIVSASDDRVGDAMLAWASERLGGRTEDLLSLLGDWAGSLEELVATLDGVRR